MSGEAHVPLRTHNASGRKVPRVALCRKKTPYLTEDQGGARLKYAVGPRTLVGSLLRGFMASPMPPDAERNRNIKHCELRPHDRTCRYVEGAGAHEGEAGGLARCVAAAVIPQHPVRLQPRVLVHLHEQMPDSQVTCVTLSK